MAITLRSSSSVPYATHTNTVVTAPAGATTGDVIIVAHLAGASSAAPTVTAPTGWTQLGSVTYSGQGFFILLTMWAHPYDGAASWTWTHASASSQAVALAYQGVNTTTIADAAATSAFSDSVNTATAPSLTTVTAGAHLIIVRGSWDGNPITPPTGWTEQYDAPILWVGDKDQPAAGATGTIAVDTGDGATEPIWGILMAALRPAAAAPSSADAFSQFTIAPTLTAKATKGAIATFDLDWTPQFSAIATAGPARTPAVENQQAYTRLTLAALLTAKATQGQHAAGRFSLTPGIHARVVKTTGQSSYAAVANPTLVLTLPTSILEIQ